MGHVGNPGSYLVYEKADLLTILAQAGGLKKGAKLNKISIYKKNQPVQTIDLEKILNGEYTFNISVQPNDTIVVDELLASKIISNSSILYSILQILNIFLTIQAIS